MFRKYKAIVGIPEPADKERLREMISATYPNMQIEFKVGEKAHLIGVHAPDRQSAAIVLPLLEKLVAVLEKNGHGSKGF